MFGIFVDSSALFPDGATGRSPAAGSSTLASIWQRRRMPRWTNRAATR